MPKLRSLWRNAGGATAIEYGLIVGLIAVSLIGASIFLADETSEVWADIRGKVVDLR
jgi:Flp pilus assembly pilin Flp